MCGLVAIIDFTQMGLWTRDGEMFFHMLLLNAMRGMDSTGVAGIWKNQKDVDIIKCIGHPFNLSRVDGWEDWKRRCNSQYSAILGHGRLATRGATNTKNAHPFQRGDITLIHNGTLSNFWELKKNYSNPEAFEVDSDCAANHIHDSGLDAFKKFEGAFAFIWHDLKDGKIRAIRNEERPLYVMERTDVNNPQWYLSSEPAIFDYVRSKGVIKGTWKTLKPGEMITFDMKKHNVEFTTVPLFKKPAHVPIHHHHNRQREISDEEANYWELWSHFQAAALDEEKQDTVLAPVGVLPKIVPKKKQTETLSSLEQGSIMLRVGDPINFTFTDYDEKHDENTNSQWCIIKGTALVDMPVEVRCRYEGNIDEIMKANVLRGTILSITPYDKNHSFVCRVFVGRPSPLVDQPVADLEGQFDKFLELADETSIPEHRFNLLCKAPCPCGQRIVSGQHSSCLIAQGLLYCPACTLNGKFPKNG